MSDQPECNGRCEPADIITGGDGAGPDPDCPLHGINAPMHQPYDVPLFPTEQPNPEATTDATHDH